MEKTVAVVATLVALGMGAVGLQWACAEQELVDKGRADAQCRPVLRCSVIVDLESLVREPMVVDLRKLDGETSPELQCFDDIECNGDPAILRTE